MIHIYNVYQVQYNDTLDSIAKKFNTTKEELKKINNINFDEELKLGNLIVVPKGDNNFTKYIVQKGDTIYSISSKYNVNPNTILKLNGLNKNDYIYPNEELIIPKENVDVYITNDGDTIDYIIENMGMNVQELMKQNNKIYVYPDQLIINKRS